MDPNARKISAIYKEIYKSTPATSEGLISQSL